MKKKCSEASLSIIKTEYKSDDRWIIFSYDLPPIPPQITVLNGGQLIKTEVRIIHHLILCFEEVMEEEILVRKYARRLENHCLLSGHEGKGKPPVL